MKVVLAVVAGFVAFYGATFFAGVVDGFMSARSPLGYYGDPGVLGFAYQTFTVLAAILAALWVFKLSEPGKLQ